MIRALHVRGYRSIRDLRLELGQVNVITGENGSGKTNLYRSLFLLAQAAAGRFASTVAEEGGMPSVLWAGPEGKRLQKKKPPRRVTITVATDDFTFELASGMTTPVPYSEFNLDPEVKEEFVWHGDKREKATTMLERRGGSAWVRDEGGRMAAYPLGLMTNSSVLSQIAEPHLYPEIAALTAEMRAWRFYHHFRTDADSPLRHPQIGVRTPVLSEGGHDLAAALQTVREIGNGEALDAAVEKAFPGSHVVIRAVQTRFEIRMRMPGMQRDFEARELSDGTLRYLCLIAALLSPRPPRVLALNEPETSLHPDLIEPLAQLIADSAASSQLWITTHSRKLADGIEARVSGSRVPLEMMGGETRLRA